MSWLPFLPSNGESKGLEFHALARLTSYSLTVRDSTLLESKKKKLVPKRQEERREGSITRDGIRSIRSRNEQWVG